MHAAVGSRSGVVGAWARRRPWLGVLVLAMIVAAVLVAALGPWRHGAAAGGTNRRAGVAALAGGSVTGGAAQFQIVPGDRPSVVVTGIGEASAPAETATLQIVVRTAESVFGPSEKPRLVPEAESPPPVEPAQVPVLTEEDLAPIAEALVDAGAPEAAVEVTAGSTFAGPFGPGTGQVVAELEEAQFDAIDGMVEAAIEAVAGAEAGLVLDVVGLGYGLADCTAVERDARQDAADDARSRAEGLAEVVGLGLGEVLLVTESPSYGYDGFAVSGCSGDPFAELSGKGGSLPPYDPNAPAEVEIYSQLSLAYAVE